MPAAQLIGGLTDAEIQSNRQALEPLPGGASASTAADRRAGAFARVCPGWNLGVLLEAAVAVFMLWPSARLAARGTRHC